MCSILLAISPRYLRTSIPAFPKILAKWVKTLNSRGRNTFLANIPGYFFSFFLILVEWSQFHSVKTNTCLVTSFRHRGKTGIKRYLVIFKTPLSRNVSIEICRRDFFIDIVVDWFIFKSNQLRFPLVL